MMQLENYLLLTIFVISLISCNNGNEENIEDLGNNIDPDQEIVDDVVISRIDTLGLKYKLTSPRLVLSFHNRIHNEEYPQGLNIQFYNQKNESQSSISAGYAHVDENGIITLKQDVVIKSDRGDMLETSHLLWDQYHRKIETDKLIRLIQTSGDTTYGFGLVADEDFSSFQIRNGFAGKRQFQNLREKLGID